MKRSMSSANYLWFANKVAVRFILGKFCISPQLVISNIGCGCFIAMYHRVLCNVVLYLIWVTHLHWMVDGTNANYGIKSASKKNIIGNR